MKASELPDDFKKEMLGRIRGQVGSARYDEMVKAVGKDGLMDLVMESMSRASDEAPRSESTSGFWDKFWDKGGWLVGLVLLLWGAGIRSQGLAVIGFLILAAWVGPRVREWIKPLGGQ